MSDDHLSIKFTEDTKKALHRNRISYQSEKSFLIALAADIIIFAITFVSPRKFTSDGELALYLMIFLGVLGFVIGFEGFGSWKKFTGGQSDGLANIESGPMSGYRYTVYREQIWFKIFVSATLGGLNVLGYLIMLKFV